MESICKGIGWHILNESCVFLLIWSECGVNTYFFPFVRWVLLLEEGGDEEISA